MVLGGFVGGFGSFWVVLGRFGWFRVLVTTLGFGTKSSLIKPYCRLKIELSSFEIHNISFRNTGFLCVCVAFLSMAYLLLFG